MSSSSLSQMQLCSQCGVNPAKFFQLESQQHSCEQCTLNEIYSQEVQS